MAKDNQTILQERARRLALPQRESAGGDTIDVVMFSIGVEKYLIESKYILEIAKLRDYTPVPGTPNFVLGLTNIRGTILALIDLRSFFTLPSRGITDLTRVIVLGTTQMEFGILAQRADQSVAISQSQILATPDSISTGTRKFVRGVSADAALFLDAKMLLQEERLTIEQ
jgi:purine-binding chemotaxis protein CheW